MGPARVGRLLVAAQLALLAAIAWPWHAPTWSAAAVLFGAGAVALGAWTLRHNRPGNFNIHPEPRAGGRLVVGGPYRYLRHPMYVAVLLFAAAMACVDPSVAKAACVVALALVLAFKAALEERLLRERYPEYAEYARRVARFIPRVY